MSRNLCVAAVAVALGLSGAAQADVGVKGVVDLSINSSDNGAPDGDGLGLHSNKTRFRVYGDEEFGNGVKAIWQIETQLDFDTGVQSNGTDNFGIKARNTFLGLEGVFGAVLAGKYDSPYKQSTAKLDIFSNSPSDYNAVIGENEGSTNDHDTRAANTLFYRTPELGGFQGMVAYIFDETRDGVDDDGYSIGATFKIAGLYLGAGYESFNQQGAGGDDDTAVKLGGSYTFADVTKVGLVWESLDGGGKGNDRDAWYLNVSQRLGTWTLKAAYGMLDDLGGTASSGAEHYALGVWKELSANTDLYLTYAMTSNDRNASYGLDQLKAGPAGADVSVIAFGLKHALASK